jgi:hypothetical protein
MERNFLGKQLAVPILAGGVFALACLAYWLAPESGYLAIVRNWGVIPGPFPFLDTHMVLSSRMCSALGFNPFAANPCDVLGRPFLYSPLMLWGAGPRELAANGVVGLALNAAFILSLFCLPRPRGWDEVVLRALAVLSAATAFAVERGNFELLILVLAAIAGRLLLRGLPARVTGYGLILIAAMCKFFPTVLFAITLRERPRLFIAVNAVAGSALALLVAGYRDELRLAAANLPQHFYFGDMFGAITFPYGLAVPFPAVPSAALLALLVAAAFGFAAWLALNPGTSRAYEKLDNAEQIFLTIGCLLMLGAFFAGQSVAYRAIHLIFVLPGLCGLARAGQPKFCRRFFAATICALLFVMWGEYFRMHTVFGLGWPVEFGFWVLREACWWWVMSVLAGLLLRFVIESEMARWLAAGFGRRAAALGNAHD